MLDDDNPTSTSTQQFALEKKILSFYQELEHFEPEEITEALVLQRASHIQYLQNGLGQLPAGFASLDASRPWICYWILHSLALLDAKLPDKPTADDVVYFLSCCQDPRGGYGGGPMQLPHLAPTYAAVCALVTLGTERALLSVDRLKMQDFLTRMCIPPEQGGGFCIHEGGEGDLRACYIAMAVAHMLGLDKHGLAERAGMVEYIRRCQTYEGGLGGEPSNEAHGGYSFCGVAALALLGRLDALDLPRLLHWGAQRQGAMEGGFNGRTNKLVDGCYSFWQGGIFPLLQQLPAWQLLGLSGPAGSAAAERSSGAASSSSHLVPRVPPLPTNMAQVKSPVEQAQSVLNLKNIQAQQLVASATQAGDAVDIAMRGGNHERGATARKVSDMTSQARVLLDRAAVAQQLAEQASLNVSVSLSSSCFLFPVPDAEDPPAPIGVGLHGEPSPSPPLYNYKALQLWILRCCQAKAGLRDKPGKGADYYHTCYCLSGLSSAQHTSNCVVGPRENVLRRADPACNVTEDKLKAALAFFGARPVPPLAGTAGGQDVEMEG
eukprot:CAMPEP_0202909804 /NCGR_PEP_ID=MMETSP1392-20130828/50321_1 /ASSEMBLY_ACC=CAM_ASM_000868 /TAXON_ID=225041 /ORGANISM="Chlamydomonas chlamydogama, Strain SAG 11-48b" /LENGTH=548 /DNA_ID=CAMNT_0049599673 /DNA_START=13 /DNA_END=1659 /DNA_ORIENTATION=-